MPQTRPSIPDRETRRKRGFTLTELMIALLIMGLIMSVVYRVFSTQEKFFRNQEQVASMQENLRATMEYINQELSWLGYKVPGIAVIKAAPTEIIFKANIPNTGSTIQYVRYVFNPSINSISRAAGATTSDVTNSGLTVMASDIEALSFSYYNILNGEVVTTDTDPLCADELTAAICNPGTPDDDASLLMVQRIKARVTARTSKPDWAYTDPNGGPDPNYRKRRAILDLRARNVEDVTLQGGHIVVGSCGYMTNTINGPYNNYDACRDKVSNVATGGPSTDNNIWDDNPSVTIQAYDKDGNLSTAGQTIVYALADDGTPYSVYDPNDPNLTNVDNTIANGETRYIAANELSTVTTSTHVNIRFAFSDGVCTQVMYDGDHDIVVSPSAASNFNSGGSYSNNGISLSYVDNSGSPTTLATPGKVAMCSTYGDERVLLGVRLDDDCGNPISGETVAWNDGGFGGTFVDEADNGDGTYRVTYIPPDSKSPVSSVYTATLGAQWGALTPDTNVDFIAAAPQDIVIDSIIDVTQAGIFQFSTDVKSRVDQLGGNSGNSFQIERVDGQQVMIKFHIEDPCGNWVYGQTSHITASSSPGTVGGVSANPDGTYSFVWWSTIGCGLETPGTITISDSAITNPGTQNETVGFTLLTTNSSDPTHGPFVVVTNLSDPSRLQAGNTEDFVDLKAEVDKYNPDGHYCSNVPGVFPVEFTVTGDSTGNGSFSNTSPYGDTLETVDTDSGGIATKRLYSGTADWNGNVMVTATANVDGATYSGQAAVGYRETFNPHDESGFYQDSLYQTEIGSDQPVTTFHPGDDLYLQIFDYDENLDPNAQDSFPLSDPVDEAKDVFVTLQSTLTGDVEKVGLSEEFSGGIAVNSAKFGHVLHTSFFPAVATTVEKGDHTLQVRDGDTITMHYQDKNNPGDAQDWTVSTLGADTFRLFKVGSPDEEVVPGPTQVTVAYGDKLRPELSLPSLAGDGRYEEGPVTITLTSGDDSDTLALRERGDTGIMVPYDSAYAGSYFTVSQTDDSDKNDILLTKTTPQYVTLVYDDPAGSPKTITFFMRDYDPPEVTIDQPDGSVDLSGQVNVMITANDVGNATTAAGISRIELYIGGRLFYTLAPGSDLSGSNTIPWVTASGTTPFWLDGSYVLQAKAYDASNNPATSNTVNVTVANGLNPIWIDPPGQNTLWSQGVDIQVNVANLASEAGTYEVLLSKSGGSVLSSWTGEGSANYTYTLDTMGLPEGSYGMIATVQDLSTGNYQTTALDIIVDRTKPNLSVSTPFDGSWVNRADFPLQAQATATDPKVDAADPNDVKSVTGTFSGACSSGPTSMTESPVGSDTYPVSLDLADCPSADGILTLTVSADDLATPANNASRAFSTRIDTVRPTVDSLTVLPMVDQSFTMGSVTFDGFARGNVTLSANVSDNHLNSGYFEALFTNDPGAPSLNPDWTDFAHLSPVLDASTGTFNASWATSTDDDGIYVLRAGVSDEAGNGNDSSPTKTLYIDNGVPTTQAPNVLVLTGGVRGPVYVRTNSQANDGFLKKVEHRFVLQGGDPDTSSVGGKVFDYTAQSMTRSTQDTYVLDPSSWANGIYVGYSYVTDWAGNTSMTGPSASFQVNIERLESGSLSATFTSVGPGQFQVSAKGRIVDGSGNGVSGENLTFVAYRGERSCDDPSCTSVTTNYTGRMYTQITNGSGQFNLTVPSADITYLNPISGVRLSDYYLIYVKDSSGNDFGYVSGYLDDPPDQVKPYQLSTADDRLISNLSTSLDSYGMGWYRITVSGKLIDRDGQPAKSVPLKFRMRSYDLYTPGYVYKPSSSTWFEVTTGTDGTFSYQVPVDLPEGPYWFRVDLSDDSDQSMGYIYQPGPTPGTVQSYLY